MTMDASPSSSLSYRWEHIQKQRYYQIVLGRDLFGDWVITKAWGGISKANGRVMHHACFSYAEAEIIIQRIIKTREKRGYRLC